MVGLRSIDGAQAPSSPWANSTSQQQQHLQERYLPGESRDAAGDPVGPAPDYPTDPAPEYPAELPPAYRRHETSRAAAIPLVPLSPAGRAPAACGDDTHGGSSRAAPRPLQTTNAPLPITLPVKNQGWYRRRKVVCGGFFFAVVIVIAIGIGVSREINRRNMENSSPFIPSPANPTPTESIPSPELGGEAVAIFEASSIVYAAMKHGQRDAYNESIKVVAVRDPLRPNASWQAVGEVGLSSSDTNSRIRPALFAWPNDDNVTLAVAYSHSTSGRNGTVTTAILNCTTTELMACKPLHTWGLPTNEAQDVALDHPLAIAPGPACGGTGCVVPDDPTFTLIFPQSAGGCVFYGRRIVRRVHVPPEEMAAVDTVLEWVPQTTTRLLGPPEDLLTATDGERCRRGVNDSVPALGVLAGEGSSTAVVAAQWKGPGRGVGAVPVEHTNTRSEILDRSIDLFNADFTSYRNLAAYSCAGTGRIHVFDAPLEGGTVGEWVLGGGTMTEKKGVKLADGKLLVASPGGGTMAAWCHAGTTPMLAVSVMNGHALGSGSGVGSSLVLLIWDEGNEVWRQIPARGQ